MKGKQLIELIQKHGLEDFEVKFVFADGFDVFPNVRTFKVSEIGDIGHSDKVFHLEGNEVIK